MRQTDSHYRIVGGHRNRDDLPALVADAIDRQTADAGECLPETTPARDHRVWLECDRATWSHIVCCDRQQSGYQRIEQEIPASWSRSRHCSPVGVLAALDLPAYGYPRLAGLEDSVWSVPRLEVVYDPDYLVEGEDGIWRCVGELTSRGYETLWQLMVAHQHDRRTAATSEAS